MAVTWITPVKFSNASTGTWEAMDASGDVSASATGVIVRIRMTFTASRTVDIRHGDSVETTPQTIAPNGTSWSCAGLNSAKEFDMWTGTTVNFGEAWLVGYFEDDATFDATPAFFEQATTATWEDVDIASATGAETAIGAIIRLNTGSSALRDKGFRMKGSTDARTDKAFRYSVAIIGVDGDEIFQQYSELAGPAVGADLIGWITKDATFNTDATDVSQNTTDSYVDLADLPAGATGGIYEMVMATSSTDLIAMRPDGDPHSQDFYDKHFSRHFWIEQEAVSLVVEQKIDQTTTDTFLVGYFEAAAAVAEAGPILQFDPKWHTRYIIG